VAGGVTPNAGKAVTITHKNDPEHPAIVQLDNSSDLAVRAGVTILPGDTIIISRSGIVYVVGDLVRPGGFLIENNERLTVLQAVALAQGTNRTAGLNRTRLIRKSAAGRQEIPVELGKILAGKRDDLRLEDGDILFVPASQSKTFAYRGIEATISMVTGMVIYNRF
jgi:polysaccharide export outer membrane protein